MSHIYTRSMRRLAALSFAATFLSSASIAVAQTDGATDLTSGLIPLLVGHPAASSTPSPGAQPPAGQPRARWARLIENPDQTDGAPPYALTDQTGTVQRYVEPVPGIDLDAHVGQIVGVRHDTGSTILASQLDLPAQPIPRRPRAIGDDRYAMNIRSGEN